MRNFHFPGRSPVMSPSAMVSTSHPLATQTGIDILKSGGNAVDAALAACATLCVVEPAIRHMAGVQEDWEDLHLLQAPQLPLDASGSRHPAQWEPRG